MSLVVATTGITFPDATSITSAKVSQLSNDTGFITSSSLPTRVSQLSNDTGFITSSSIPTRVSQLSNDSGFITSASIPSYYYNGIGTYTTVSTTSSYSIGGNYGLSGLSGTWKCMSFIVSLTSASSSYYVASTTTSVYLFLRIA